MTIYSHLTEKDIDTILDAYDLGKVISWKALSGGSENSNYILSTEKSKYVLTICEQKSKAEAIQLAGLLEHLQKNQFQTSIIFRNKLNQLTSLWNGKPVLLKSYIKGNIIQDLTPDLLKLIGRELASLHLVQPQQELPDILNYGKESFQKVKTYAQGSEFDLWLQDILDYIAPYFNLDLPRSLIHGDLFWNNIIVSEDQQSIVIMDFEEAAYYYRVFDIGMTIIGTCGEMDHINTQKVGYLLEGYHSVIQLTEEETKSLKAFTVYAGASMTFWRHFNFNYTNPQPGMSNHYLELKLITDYIMDQNEDCFSRFI